MDCKSGFYLILHFYKSLHDFSHIFSCDSQVQHMDVGEVAEVKMSPRFSYGELGQ